MRRRTGGRSLAGLSFLQSSDDDVATWWTSAPVRAPMMVGWAGGPKAARLIARGAAEVEARTIAALSRLFGMRRQRAESLIEGCWYHDWDDDPLSRGAYSYTLVGGRDAPANLARPLARTLFLAGEASDPEGRTGTVHGAISTGRRAAAQVIRTLSARRRR